MKKNEVEIEKKTREWKQKKEAPSRQKESQQQYGHGPSESWIW